MNKGHNMQIIDFAKRILSLDNAAFQALFDSAPVAMALIDPESMRILVVNEMTVKLFGYSFEEFINKTPLDVTYPGDIVISEDNLEQYKSDFTNSCVIEKRFIKKDGTVFWAEAAVTLLDRKGEGGSILIGTIIDITDRKLTEKSLRDYAHEIENLYNNAPCGYHSLDHAGYFVRINNTELDWLGYSREEVIGKLKWTDVITPAGQKTFEQEFMKFVERGYVTDLEYELIGKNGRMFNGLLNATAEYDESGNYLKSRGTLIDISAVKATQKSLQESYESLLQFVEYSPAALAMFDRNMCYLAASQKWMSDYGLEGQDVIGRSHYDVFPEIPQRWKEIHKRALAGEAISANEDVLIRSDGSAQWLNWQIRPWHTPGKDFGGIIIFSEDITDRVLAQNALKESEKRLRIFIEHAPVAIAMFDEEMHYLAVSRRWLSDFKISDSDLIGQSHYKTFPDLPDRWRDAIRAGMSGEKVRCDEDYFERADGTYYWLNWEIWPWKQDDGRVGGVLLFAEVINERMRMKDWLKLWGESFEKSGLGLCIIDAKSHTFISVNPAFSALNGYTPEELTGRPFFTVIAPDHSDKAKSILTEIDNKQHIVFETENLRQDGGRIPILLDMTATESTDGMPRAYVAYMLDISKRKMSESKLREQDELLKEMSSISHMGAWSFDPITQEGTWTEEVARIHDLPLAESLNVEFGFSFYHGEYRKKIESAVREAIESGKPYDLELELVSSKGKHKWVRTICHPVIENGTVVKVRGTIQDISESKDVEIKTRDRDARYRAVLGSTIEGFIMFNGAYQIIEVNEAYIAQSGYSREELLTMSIYDLEAMENERETDKHIRKIQIQGHDRFETLHRRKDGSIWPAELTVNYVPELQDLIFSFVLDITDRKNAESRISDYVKQLENSMYDTLKAVSKMVEQRDPYTAGHERRVGLISADIAREMGWDETRCRALEMIGLVHDIGKISVPAEILSKPGKLTGVEYSLVKEHVRNGYDILKDVEFQAPVAEIIYQHHERLNGSGYPRGLKANQILPEAKIVMVADVVESITSHRPYRPALGLDAALHEITSNRGILYDADVVDAFLKLIDKKGYEYSV